MDTYHSQGKVFEKVVLKDLVGGGGVLGEGFTFVAIYKGKGF